MAVKAITQAGDPVLHTVTQLVPDVQQAEIKTLIADLVDTLRAGNLIGIAAPQIGESWQICVTEIRKTEFRDSGFTPLEIYINPTIVYFSPETDTDWEGCGSVNHTDTFARVSRPQSITVEYLDEHGVAQAKPADGLMARLLQHEIDHLNGILFIDHVDQADCITAAEYKNIRHGKK